MGVRFTCNELRIIVRQACRIRVLYIEYELVV